LDVVHGVFICGAMAMGQRSIMWMINGNPDGDDYRSIDGKGNGATRAVAVEMGQQSSTK
jgi:hypothetical protein